MKTKKSPWNCLICRHYLKWSLVKMNSKMSLFLVSLTVPDMNLTKKQCCSQDAPLRYSPLFPRNTPSFSLKGAPSCALKYKYYIAQIQPPLSCHSSLQRVEVFLFNADQMFTTVMFAIVTTQPFPASVPNIWSCTIKDKTRSLSELGYPVVRNHGK